MKHRLLTRRNVLSASLVLCHASSSWSQVAPLSNKVSQAHINLTSAGAKGDGVTDDGKVIVDTLQKYRRMSVYVPKGNYSIDNPPDGLVVNDFEGLLVLDPDAYFTLKNPESPGFIFLGGRGAWFENLNLRWHSAPQVLMPNAHSVAFIRTVDTILTNLRIDGAPTMGAMFRECVRPHVSGAIIKHCMADGLHFANCKNSHAKNLFISDTGDDGLAFVNYEEFAPLRGGYATNVNVTRSKARGISVIGQSDVFVSNFTVDGTSSSGVICATDASWKTRRSENVDISQGVIVDAGMMSFKRGNQFGIEYEDVTSVSFRNISISKALSSGVCGRGAAQVLMQDVTVADITQGTGATLQAKNLTISGLGVKNVAGYGLYVYGSETVAADQVVVTNASQVSELRRAAAFEGNQSVRVGEMSVHDSQVRSTGYKVGFYGPLQRGSVNILNDFVSNELLSVDNQSQVSVGQLLRR